MSNTVLKLNIPSFDRNANDETNQARLRESAKAAAALVLQAIGERRLPLIVQVTIGEGGMMPRSSKLHLHAGVDGGLSAFVMPGNAKATPVASLIDTVFGEMAKSGNPVAVTAAQTSTAAVQAAIARDAQRSSSLSAGLFGRPVANVSPEVLREAQARAEEQAYQTWCEANGFDKPTITLKTDGLATDAAAQAQTTQVRARVRQSDSGRFAAPQESDKQHQEPSRGGPKFGA